MNIAEQKEKFLTAQKLLDEKTTTKEKLSSLTALLKGGDPKIDKLLALLSKALSTIDKLQGGQIIELAAENLPQETEGDKKRKKAILLFIKNWNQLKSEVKRVRSELEKTPSQGDLKTAAKIASFSKGAFGIITVLAVVIAGVLIWQKNQSPKNQVSETRKEKIQIIEFGIKQVPLSEIEARTGPDCDSEHYHAKDHQQAKALDGSVVTDPGGCGFGKVSETEILTIIN